MIRKGKCPVCGREVSELHKLRGFVRNHIDELVIGQILLSFF